MCIGWWMGGARPQCIYIYVNVPLRAACRGGCGRRLHAKVWRQARAGAQVSGAAPAPHSGSVGLLLLLLLCAAVRRGRRLLPLLPVRFAPPCRVSCRAQTQQRERRSVSYPGENVVGVVVVPRLCCVDCALPLPKAQQSAPPPRWPFARLLAATLHARKVSVASHFAERCCSALWTRRHSPARADWLASGREDLHRPAIGGYACALL